jgi:hypothetical protein
MLLASATPVGEAWSMAKKAKGRPLGAACDEHLAFLRDYGFLWIPDQARKNMAWEAWEASSAVCRVVVSVNRLDKVLVTRVGPAGTQGLAVDKIAAELGVAPNERPKFHARTRRSEAGRVAEHAAFVRDRCGRLLAGDFSEVDEALSSDKRRGGGLTAAP